MKNSKMRVKITKFLKLTQFLSRLSFFEDNQCKDSLTMDMTQIPTVI